MNSVVRWLSRDSAARPTSARVHGLGLYEIMPAGLILRPTGSEDYLFMHFHDPVQVWIDGELRDVPAHTFFIWTPGARHHFGHPGKLWKHSWVHCDGSAVATDIAGSGLPIGRAVTLPDASLTERWLLPILAEVQAHTEPDPVILAHLFGIWIRELQRVVNPGPEAAARVPKRFLAVTRYIEENLAQPITLKDLAACANLSASQFSMAFKHCFGTSPIDYVLDQRLKQAIYYLRDHNLTISEVAHKIGFQDAFHFSRQFKKRHGISPLLYRRTVLSVPTGQKQPARLLWPQGTDHCTDELIFASRTAE